MLRYCFVIGLLIASLSIADLAGAQEPVKPPLNPRIITATRLVTLFTGIEKQMLQAVQKKDGPALRELVTEDFAVHLPDADPMPADDWIESVLSNDYALKSFTIRQVDAADLGTAVVVSYDRVQESTYKGQSDGGESYVVDVWKKDGNNWKLSDRYVSKVSSTPFMPKADAKPSGKQ